MAVTARIPVVLQPLCGALLGLCGCGLMLVLPRGSGAVAALALWIAASLAAGERGFARWFPTLPLFGALLAACTVLLRWYALLSLQRPSGPLSVPVIAAMALGPAASVALAWISRPVDDAAFRRLSTLSTTTASVALAEGIAASLACGIRIGSILAISAYLLMRLVSRFLEWRFAGVRGSDLDAFRVFVETAALVVAASL